jgi:hypothetical protein
MTKETFQETDRQNPTPVETELKPQPSEIERELIAKIGISNPGEIEREFRGLVPHPSEVERGEIELKPIPAEDNGIAAQDLGLAPARADERRRLPEMGENGERRDPPPDKIPNVWVYDGDAYDLTEFIQKHPGGDFFIGRTKNRDITTIVNIFHRNPERVKRVLKPYALGRPAIPEDVHPKYTAPPFLFKPDFNGWIDTPKFNFNRPDQLLDRIRTRLKEPEMQAKVDRMDRLFDAVSVAIFTIYIFTQWLRLTHVEYMPIYLFVPLMAILRISLSGVGHYLIHRPQVGWTKIFAHIFDFNYVPMTLVVTDGHSLMHHPFTQSEVDIKRNVFTGMLELPRFYRVPVHTVHKFGHVVCGMLLRTVEIIMLTARIGVKDSYGTWPRASLHFSGAMISRLITMGELIIFCLHGDAIAWFAQFILTLWISTFMIVASHDFEDADAVDFDKLERQDWAVSQIENSYDLTIIGHKYIDCFLSAGLAPHRVHHVLPFQKSGFANIISEDIVRSEAAKFDLPWLPAKNFFIDRLPITIDKYLNVPSRIASEQNLNVWQEHFRLDAIKATIDYAMKGYTGIGSI